MSSPGKADHILNNQLPFFLPGAEGCAPEKGLSRRRELAAAGGDVFFSLCLFYLSLFHPRWLGVVG